MSDITLFKNNALATSDLFKSLQSMNDNLGGNSFGTTRRISLRGSKFREIVNGEQIKVSKHDTMNIVIVDAARVSRTFYAGAYDPDNAAAPTCWSAGTESPSPDVPDPESKRCGDCPQNIKGSGQGETRACRFSQKLAIVLEGDWETVYQLQLPATSIFGEAKENHLAMQAYARFLNAHNTPAIAVVTEMRFDEDSDVPKLFFRPVRPLEEDELKAVVALRETEEVRNAVTFKVYDTDKGKAPKAKEEDVIVTTSKKAKKAEVKEEEEEEVEEPTKKSSKKDEDVPEEKTKKLASLINQWDD